MGRPQQRYRVGGLGGFFEGIMNDDRLDQKKLYRGSSEHMFNSQDYSNMAIRTLTSSLQVAARILWA